MRRALLALTALVPGSLAGQQPAPGIGSTVQSILARPEYRHSRWGIRFVSLDDGKVLYSLNEQQLFLPGSTAKLYPQATALRELGPDYRFRTRVYRTGPLTDGVLRGDLVLVASGDPNLSNRLQPDGTLAYRHPDHSYDGVPGAAPLPGDPLGPFRRLVDRIAATGLRRIEGRVLVDGSLFPERPWIPAAPMVVISPMVLNDNIVDVTVTPGARPGDSTRFAASPETPYVRFVNRVATGTATSRGGWGFAEDTAGPDGTRTVTLTGSLPAGGPPVFHAWFVRDPTRFAMAALGQLLREKGIEGRVDLTARADFGALAASYRDENLMAEHVSPPWSATAKIVLKLSHNPQASMTFDLIGSIAGKDRATPVATGLGFERKLFEDAGLDLSAAVQNEGAGTSSQFTPHFTVEFLRHVAREPWFPAFRDALPILGRDGSLIHTQVRSPAAGHVRAKTGTGAQPNGLGGNLLLEAKALAGYMEAPNGNRVAFAVYVNYVPAPGLEWVLEEAGPGEAIGEIVSAVYRTIASGPGPRKPAGGRERR